MTTVEIWQRFTEAIGVASNTLQIGVAISTGGVSGGLGYLLGRRRVLPAQPESVEQRVARSPHHSDALQIVCETTHRINHTYRELLAPLTELQGIGQDEVADVVSDGLRKICPLMAAAFRRLEKVQAKPALNVSIYFDTAFKTDVGLVATTVDERFRDGTKARWNITRAPFREGIYDTRLDLTFWENGNLPDGQWLAGWGADFTSALIVPIRGQPSGPRRIKQLGYLVVEASSASNSAPFSDCTKRLAAAYSDQLFSYFNIMLKLYSESLPGSPDSPGQPKQLTSGSPTPRRPRGREDIR